MWYIADFEAAPEDFAKLCVAQSSMIVHGISSAILKNVWSAKCQLGENALGKQCLFWYDLQVHIVPEHQVCLQMSAMVKFGFSI